MATTVDTAVSPSYAGFWRRLAAYAIDYVLVTLVTVGIGALISLALGMLDAGMTMGSISALADLFGLVGSWMYFAFMESSEWQATFGKMALGMRVTDLDGQRVSLRRASVRYYAKILSALLVGAGFLLAAISGRKQALHDKVARTYVVKAR